MTTTTARSTVRTPDVATTARTTPEGPDGAEGPPRAGRPAPAPAPRAAAGTATERPTSLPAGTTGDGTSRRTPAAAERPHPTPELLGTLPYQLGFRPEECVVAVGLRGPRRDVGLVARIDLDDVLSPAGPDLLDDVAGHLAADDAAEVVVVVYCTEDDPRDLPPASRPAGGSHPQRSAPQRAAETARAALEPLGPVTTWMVARGRYLALACRDATCCPPGGRALAELEPDGIGGAVTRARPLPRRTELAAVPVAPAGRRRSAAAARSRWTDARLRASGPDALLRWRQRSLQTWRAAVADATRSPGGDADLRPAQLGRIEAALDDTTLRDAVVLALIRPEATLPDALLRHLPHSDGAEPGDDARTAGVAEAGDGAASEDVAGPVEHPGEAGADALAGDDARMAPDLGDARDGASTAEDGGPEGPEAGGATGVPGAERVDGTPRSDAGARAPGRARPLVDAASVSAAVRRTLDVLLEPEHAEEPRPEVADAARTVLEAVVAHGRAGRQAPACTLLALLAWWGADAIRARLLVDRALAEDPTHRLAQLLDRALGVGLVPGWMRRRC